MVDEIFLQQIDPFITILREKIDLLSFKISAGLFQIANLQYVLEDNPRRRAFVRDSVTKAQAAQWINEYEGQIYRYKKELNYLYKVITEYISQMQSEYEKNDYYQLIKKYK